MVKYTIRAFFSNGDLNTKEILDIDDGLNIIDSLLKYANKITDAVELLANNKVVYRKDFLHGHREVA